MATVVVKLGSSVVADEAGELRTELLEALGDAATVRVVIDTDGVRAPRLFQLEREDGRWKLADGTEG